MLPLAAQVFIALRRIAVCRCGAFRVSQIVKHHTIQLMEPPFFFRRYLPPQSTQFLSCQLGLSPLQKGNDFLPLRLHVNHLFFLIGQPEIGNLRRTANAHRQPAAIAAMNIS